MLGFGSLVSVLTQSYLLFSTYPVTLLPILLSSLFYLKKIQDNIEPEISFKGLIMYIQNFTSVFQVIGFLPNQAVTKLLWSLYLTAV